MKTFNSSEVLNRLKQTLSITKDSDLATYLNISKSTLSNWSARNSIDYNLVFSKCEHINLDWLLTGHGEMTKVNQPSKITKGIVEHQNISLETRPRIPLNAAAGALSVCLDGITANKCEQMPIIGAFTRYDFTIMVHGDSMEPNYLSGDELAGLYIKNTSFIQWGRTHILDTAQGIIVKNIYDNDDAIICKSENPRFSDFSIPKNEIYNIALVIGLIRRY